MSAVNGVYWVGSDGNYWVKAAGIDGVQNFGSASADNPNIDVINGLSQIDDPNAPPKEATVTNTDTGAGTATSSAGSSYNPADLSYLDSQTSQLQRQLQSAQSGLSSGLTGLSDSYNKNVSEQNLNRSRALEDYQTQRTDMTNSKDRALTGVDTNARTLNDSLRRILGLASGANSSAYQFAAPNAVARQASGQRTGVLDTYGVNERNIATNEDRAKVDFANLLTNLADQRKQKESGLRSGIYQQEIGINQNLADVASQRAKLLGGTYDSAQAAQQPYVNEINSRENALDHLFSQFRTPYSITPVNVKPADLANYTVDKARINTNAQSGTKDPYSPYTYFLNKQNQDQQASLV